MSQSIQTVLIRLDGAYSGDRKDDFAVEVLAGQRAGLDHELALQWYDTRRDEWRMVDGSHIHRPGGAVAIVGVT